MDVFWGWKSPHQTPCLGMSRNCHCPWIAKWILSDSLNRCPALKILRFFGTPSTMWRSPDLNVLEFYQNLAHYLGSGALQSLSRLEVNMLSLKDQETASVIHRLPCLSVFKSKELGALSLPGIRCHFSFICEIDIEDSSSIPELWHEALSSCPNLESVSHVFLSLESIFNGKNWICTNLRKLCLTFGETGSLMNEEQLYISKKTLLKRISSLNNLGWLSIDATTTHFTNTSRNSRASETHLPTTQEFQPRFDNQTLKLIASLTKLTRLEFSRGYCWILDELIAQTLGDLKFLKRFTGYWYGNGYLYARSERSVSYLERRRIYVDWCGVDQYARA